MKLLIFFNFLVMHMKKLILSFILLVCTLGIIAFKRDAIVTYLQNYTATSAQTKFGKQRLAEQYEQMIRSIADRMGIQEQFTVRKMNTYSTQVMGYHNAFALQPLLFGFIPVGLSPFMFVSEGFFEDLSQQEQEFLIGHELIHIERAHVRYFNLIYYLLLVIVIAVWFLLRRKIRSMCGKKVWLYPVATFIMLFCCSDALNVAGLAYKRSIEYEADSTSVALLNSYDGGMALIKRWQKEFRMPLHNDWWGLFSDHPSCHERIAYFSQVKQQQERSSCEQC